MTLPRYLLNAVALLGVALPVTFAQSTAFTYQGRLDASGQPANGLFSLKFSLHNAAAGGALVGTPLTNTPVSVVNGLFTVTLDFGLTPFDGTDRWLELGVRTNGVNTAHTVLAPRQAVTATPYAIRATTAGTAATVTAGGVAAGQLAAGAVTTAKLAANAVNSAIIADGSVGLADLGADVGVWTKSGANLSYTGGAVGIGTATPGATLSLGNTLANTKLALYDNGAASYGLGVQGNQFRFHTGTANDRFSFLSGPTGTEHLTIRGDGNVGVGITTPSAQLSLGSTVANTKLALYDNGTHAYGLGVQANTFRLHTSSANDRFGFFNAPGGTETVTITGDGKVGLGITKPRALLSLGTNVANIKLALYEEDGTDFFYGLGVQPNTFILSTATANDTFEFRGGQFATAKASIHAGLGELTCTAVNLTSDRNAKEEFKPVNAREVLAKVARLPISEWQYKGGDQQPSDGTRHLGPMAQDFRAAFALGRDEKHIASVDADGVALAAIQGLNEKLEEKTQEVDALKQSVATLTELVNRLAAQQNGGSK